MAAEMCLTYLVWDRERKLNFAAGRKYIEDIKAEENGMIVDDEGNEHDRENILGSLNSIELAVQDSHKEGAVIQIGHLYILMTGAPSWGDSPTELYDDICNLSRVDFGIFAVVGFDLPEDLMDYKSVLMKILKTKEIRPLLLGLDDSLDKLIERKIK